MCVPVTLVEAQCKKLFHASLFPTPHLSLSLYARHHTSKPVLIHHEKLLPYTQKYRRAEKLANFVKTQRK